MDALLLSHPSRARAVQNIGGIANVTYLPPSAGDGPPIAFDTGPGNMLMDAIAGLMSGGDLAYDHDGAMAAQGTVDAALLAELMAEPYLHAPPPKTTGRERFGVQVGEQLWKTAQAQDLAGENLLGERRIVCRKVKLPPK